MARGRPGWCASSDAPRQAECTAGAQGPPAMGHRRGRRRVGLRRPRGTGRWSETRGRTSSRSGADGAGFGNRAHGRADHHGPAQKAALNLVQTGLGFLAWAFWPTIMAWASWPGVPGLGFLPNVHVVRLGRRLAVALRRIASPTTHSHARDTRRRAGDNRLAAFEPANGALYAHKPEHQRARRGDLRGFGLERGPMLPPACAIPLPPRCGATRPWFVCGPPRLSRSSASAGTPCRRQRCPGSEPARRPSAWPGWPQTSDPSRDRHRRRTRPAGRLLTGPVQANRAATKASGSKGSRSPTASPTPTKRTGTLRASSIAKTMPPLAVESSFVRTIPVSPTASWKALA